MNERGAARKKAVVVEMSRKDKVYRLLTLNKNKWIDGPILASTLGTLFGAIAVAYLLRAIDGERVARRVRIDLFDETRTGGARLLERLRRDAGLVGLLWRMR